ncbi:ASCH domain-containing protein [Streptomyces sp. NPDC001389]|uniref:ASCH domain-containing protein n=1 Tax=unclassified Streptomyces TaxID=2593676 RepID=UPI00368AC17D
MDSTMHPPTEDGLGRAEFAQRLVEADGDGEVDTAGAAALRGARRPAAVQALHFHPAYLDAVRTGRKTTTVRFRDPVEPGPVDLVFELEDEVVLPGVVTRITSKSVDELTGDDAVADGFRDLAELRDRLRFHYPDIASTDEVAVVHFRRTG